jgi:hypothetical protein
MPSDIFVTMSSPALKEPERLIIRHGQKLHHKEGRSQRELFFGEDPAHLSFVS